MSTGGLASGVIFLRPQEGKTEKLKAFLEKNLSDIRENVDGVLVTFYFWSARKNQFVVVESFESTEAMFAYGNSKYHEDLVSKVIELGVTPFEAFTSQDDQQELEDFRNTEQAIHFAL
ncbi:hypothetical protein CNMCM8694_006622 [Aspergillus lentulus]|nr:hypothetical protein CNMCM8060_007068 [Aspergillus lentulus]KAF4184143.1 hypothetical protein CNMCM7927_008333 [Aspergillus lentulus]KAF4195191.1 hypothetical protein CNMCM8694_006622 [Aspergillus lentulus]